MALLSKRTGEVPAEVSPGSEINDLAANPDMSRSSTMLKERAAALSRHNIMREDGIYRP